MNKEQELIIEINTIENKRKKRNLTDDEILYLRYLNGQLKGYREAIQEKDAEFNKERDKWIEERGRMAKLLFKKGINKW